jgi:hypothetical protein
MERKILYVALSGCDEQTGSKEQPLATLEGARDRIRKLKQRGELPSGGVEVRLREGTYRVTETFKLTKEDSGSEDAPTVYTAYEGEKVRITAGIELSASVWHPVTDASVLDRLAEAARPHIRQFRLSEVGINSWEPIKQTGFGYPPSLQSPELFVDGHALTLSRYPKKNEYVQISEVIDPGGNPREFNEDAVRHESEKRKGATFRCEDTRMAAWKQTGDLWMEGFWYWDWADCTLKISSMDTSTGTISTEQASHYSIRSGQRFYFYNVLEELNSPGEWYVDRESGIVYAYPPTNLEDAAVELSLFGQPILMTEGASHIRFRKLQVEVTRAEAILIRGGEDVAVEGCMIGKTGGFAIAIGDPQDYVISSADEVAARTAAAGYNHAIRSCDIYDAGGGGIYMAGGDRMTLKPGGHVAVNNDISNYSRLKRTYSPAIEIFGVGNQALRNAVHDAPHMGIYIHGNDHLIEGNDITRIIQETGDAGAIYLGRDWTEQGNIIRYNRISQIGNKVTKWQIGVYLDDMASGTTVYGNIIHETERAILVGSGRSNRIVNNLIACCKEALIIDTRSMPGDWAALHAEEGQVMHKRLLAVPYQSPVWRERYPELVNIWEDEASTPKYNVVTNNLSYRNKTITIHGIPYEDSLAVMPPALQSGEKRDNVAAADGIPFIVPGDPASGVAPDQDNELLKHFQPIPVEQIGLYEDEYRTIRSKGE